MVFSKSLFRAVDSDPHSGSAKSAFTLIELLVVIAVITILIAMLLPALSKAREQAIRTQCASNERQCFMALYMYAVDNKGAFPVTVNYWGAGYWMPDAGLAFNASLPPVQSPGATPLLKSYYNNNYAVLFCPSFLLNSMAYNTLSDGSAHYWWYWQNGGVTTTNNIVHIVGYEFMTNPGVTNSSVGVGYPNPLPSDTPTSQFNPAASTFTYWVKKTNEKAGKVVICDASENIGGGSLAGWQDWAVAHWDPHNNKQKPLGSNVCYIDGHVQWRLRAQLVMRYNFSGGGGGGGYQEWW